MMRELTVDEQLTKRREAKLAEVPARARGMYRQAWARTSRRAAIRAHCLECMGYLAPEVRVCTSHGCALFEYRTGRAADG